jgi:acetyl/propionyl-CoA carboxylase alpha subunit
MTLQTWPFDTVLIASRGEIALRIFRSLQPPGLRAPGMACSGGNP